MRRSKRTYIKKLVAVPVPARKEIGARIRRLRKDRWWNLYDMEAVTGIPRKTLACYECGARVPILRNAIRISTALRRTLDFVLLGRCGRRKGNGE